MNLNIERCRTCDTQCILEDRRDRIKKQASEAKLSNGDSGLTKYDQQALRGQVSTLTQIGYSNACPPSEIHKIRSNALEAVDPAFKSRLQGLYPLGPLSGSSLEPTAHSGFISRRKTD